MTAEGTVGAPTCFFENRDCAGIVHPYTLSVGLLDVSFTFKFLMNFLRQPRPCILDRDRYNGKTEKTRRRYCNFNVCIWRPWSSSFLCLEEIKQKAYRVQRYTFEMFLCQTRRLLLLLQCFTHPVQTQKSKKPLSHTKRRPDPAGI
jgi:hypothetical protein